MIELTCDSTSVSLRSNCCEVKLKNSLEDLWARRSVCRELRLKGAKVGNKKTMVSSGTDIASRELAYTKNRPKQGQHMVNMPNVTAKTYVVRSRSEDPGKLSCRSKEPTGIVISSALATRKCRKMNGRITLTRQSQHCHTVVKRCNVEVWQVTNLVSKLISNA